MSDIIKKTQKIASVLKNFSNKEKLSILCFLWNEEKNVSEIMKCSHLSQSQISQYLGRMKLEWILESRKLWKEVYYKICDKNAKEIIKSLKDIFK